MFIDVNWSSDFSSIVKSLIASFFILFLPLFEVLRLISVWEGGVKTSPLPDWATASHK
jgi:hypothetical protein